ncbi:MAG: WecB/TagA/CpsF family glycosyltransferase [Candidatus Methanospirareceae archaeon]
MKRIFQNQPCIAEILGVKVNLVDYAETIVAMEDAISNRSQLTITFVNVHSIMTAQKDEEFRNSINNSSLSVPDGMPLVWISRWTDTPLTERVYGPDLFRYFCNLSEHKGYSHFFYGSSPLVLQRLTTRFSHVRISGSISPPYGQPTLSQEYQFIEKIKRSNADVLWVGLGCPKQEKWMNRVRSRISVPVIAGVGAAFDFHAGMVRQAPRSWQRYGLEWLFRLIQEPRRLAFRYLVYNSLFLLKIGMQIIRGRPS